MLRFLERREDDKPGRCILRTPHLTFGISLESPREFQTDHSSFSNRSFVNPFIPYQKERYSVIPTERTTLINGSWTRKADPNLIEEQKILSSQPIEIVRDRFKKSYYESLEHNSMRFRRTRGQFSDFIQRNSSNTYLGPLQGEERNMDKARQTRKAILDKSLLSLEKSREKLKLSPKKAVTINPLDTIRDFRNSRRELHGLFESDLGLRKTKRNRCFDLPRVVNRSGVATERPSVGLEGNKTVQVSSQLRSYINQQPKSRRKNHGMEYKS